ncbi:MAG: fused MFS/spermidine synthase [Pseudomonadota bacterium]
MEGATRVVAIMRQDSGRTMFLMVLMLASGFAGLGYEIAWTRAVSVALGHEIVAVLAVVAAFFAGLGIGAWLLDGPVRRSRRPARWYAALETIIALWAVALIWLIPSFNELVSHSLGIAPSQAEHWLTAFGATFVLLLPATMAMGGTLPSLERVLGAEQSVGSGVARLYSANTLGAVIGTLLTTALIMPAVGTNTTLLMLATVNLLCAILAIGVADIEVQPVTPIAAALEPSPLRLTALLAMSGLLAIGFEVVVIRVLSQVLENTVFTFASLLSIYLVGTAGGAALYARIADASKFEPTLHFLLISMSISMLLSTVVLYFSKSLHLLLTELTGNGYVAAISGEMLLAGLVFILPTMVMGALFGHLAQTARERYGVGKAIGVNTLAAAFSPLLFGVVLLPAVGPKLLLVGIALSYLLMIVGGSRHWRALTFVPLAGGFVFALVMPSLRIMDVPEGGEILSYTDGVMASVGVVTDRNGTRYLKVNDHFTMGSSATQFSDARQTHIPLLLHQSPESALYLGLGTGSTFAASAAYPDLFATGVELIPEVISAIRYFDEALSTKQEQNSVHVVASDARRFVRTTEDRFDVVIGEVFHPSRDGSGSLYTVEHFEAIRRTLSDDGLYCQWLPLFQLDLETLATIVRTFQSVYPDSEAYLAHFSLGQPIIGLVGRVGGISPRRGWLRERVKDRSLAEALVAAEIGRDLDLFGLMIADANALGSFAGEGPLNSDNFPLVTYMAPGFVYSAPEPAHVRLFDLLDQLEMPSGRRFVAPDSDGFHREIENYWTARDAYLKLGAKITPSADPRVMLDQLEQPFLEILETSAEFTPAYRPLVELAYQLSESSPQEAIELLDAVIEVAPDQPQARQLRAYILSIVN